MATIESTSLLKKLFSGATWSSFGTIVYRASALISFIFIARIIGIEEFGKFSVLQATVTMLSVFACFGLTNAATRYIAKFSEISKSKYYEIINLIFFTAIISSVLVASIYSIIGQFFIEYSSSIFINKKAIYLSSILLLLSSHNSVIEGILFGMKQFKYVSISKFFCGIVLLLSALFLTNNYLLNGALTALVISQSIMWFLFVAKISNKLRLSFFLNLEITEKYFDIFKNFSIPSLISSSILAPTRWISIIFLVKFGKDLNEVAIFNAANQWVIALLFLPNIISKVSLPILSQIPDNKEVTFLNFLKISIGLNFLIVFLFSVPIILGSSFLMSFYGDSFSGGATTLKLGAVSACLISINSSIGNVFLSKAKLWLGLSFNIVWALLMIFLSYILSFNGFGATGLMLAILISYSVHTILQVFYIFKFLKVSN